jgi:hypothetical protein
MDAGEHTTGTRDEHYNLVSILYHALQAADSCDRYALDAEASGGDEQLVGFYREAQMVQMQVAERAKVLLGIIESPPEFGPPPGTEPRRGGVPPPPEEFP